MKPGPQSGGAFAPRRRGASFGLPSMEMLVSHCIYFMTNGVRTHDGRAYRTLNIIDEFTKEALAIRVKRKL
ncbi:hypothetical protein SAMN04488026_11211, partial [Aliiruegeria lutimaris]